MTRPGHTQDVRSTAAAELDDGWWTRGSRASGPATVSIPVGGGRRRFLGDVLDRARGIAPEARLLLVTPRAHLARLWHEDLAARYPGLRVGRAGARRRDPMAELDVLVATSNAAEDVPVDRAMVVVVDEPHLIAHRRLARIHRRTTGCRWRIDLRTAMPSPSLQASAPDDSQAGHVGRATLSDHQLDVGRLIAGLLDGELEARQPSSFLGWAARHLGTTADRLRLSHTTLDGVELDVVAARIAETLDSALVAGGSSAPEWRTIPLGDDSIEVPSSVRLVPSAETFGLPLALELEPRDDGSGWLRMACETHRFARARAAHSQLRSGADLAHHPYRFRTLRVTLTVNQLSSEVIPPPADTRDDLVLPAVLWDEVDRNVHGVLRHRERLQNLGLGVDRGILLHGPPGTGKTQLARVLAQELSGQVTAFFPEPAVVGSRLEALYRLARTLAPSLVVLEDIDLIAGSRSAGGGSSLADLLTTLDGLMTSDGGVITLASTNDPGALDEAATRAARFDRILEVPLPPPEGRRRIWTRYLGELGDGIDVERLAAATDGASGADVRELVRHAVLRYDGELTTARLLELCHDRGFHRPATGFYL